MKQVLVADNHPIICQAVSELINNQRNFNVIAEESNGLDVFMRVQEGGIDIVVTDLSMPPGENGLLTIKRLHEHFPKLPILVFSMHNEASCVNQALYNGANGYVLKTSAVDELVAGLKHVANHERYLDNNIMVTKADLQAIADGIVVDGLADYVKLSKREEELLPFIVLGYSNKEIAAKMYISPKTVEAHKANIMHKLNAKSFADLLSYAYHHHLIDL